MYRGEYALNPENGALLQGGPRPADPPLSASPTRRSAPFGAAPVREIRSSTRRPGNAMPPRASSSSSGAGGSVDPMRLLDAEAPSVRVVVNEQALRTGDGFGAIEGNLPWARSPWRASNAGCAPATCPSCSPRPGQPLNLGRDERLFTRAQRLAISIRDGVCREPDCDRTTLLDLELRHQALETRPRQHGRRRRHPVMPTRSPPRAQRRQKDHPRPPRPRPAHPATFDRPGPNPALYEAEDRAQITHPVTLPAELRPAATATGEQNPSALLCASTADSVRASATGTCAPLRARLTIQLLTDGKRSDLPEAHPRPAAEGRAKRPPEALTAAAATSAPDGRSEVAWVSPGSSARNSPPSCSTAHVDARSTCPFPP